MPIIDWLIEEGLIVTNDLVLAELLPALLLRGERRLAGLLRDVERLPLTLDWNGIIEMQVTCLRHGINKLASPISSSPNMPDRTTLPCSRWTSILAS